MNLDEQIANAAARAAVAARNGDDDAWREWSDTATRLLDHRDRSDKMRRGVLLLSGLSEADLDSVGGCPTASFYARPAS